MLPSVKLNSGFTKMYLIKGKRLLDKQDSRESEGKGVRLSCDSTPEMSSQTSTESGDSVDGLAGSKPLNPEDPSYFNPDELPDGYSFSPQRIQPKNGGDNECPVRDAEVSPFAFRINPVRCP